MYLLMLDMLGFLISLLINYPQLWRCFLWGGNQMVRRGSGVGDCLCGRRVGEGVCRAAFTCYFAGWYD